MAPIFEGNIFPTFIGKNNFCYFAKQTRLPERFGSEKNIKHKHKTRQGRAKFIFMQSIYIY